MIMHILSCYGLDTISGGVLESQICWRAKICSSDEGQQPVVVNTGEVSVISATVGDCP